jgi:hypothetical protein
MDNKLVLASNRLANAALNLEMVEIAVAKAPASLQGHFARARLLAIHRLAASKLAYDRLYAATRLGCGPAPAQAPATTGNALLGMLAG